MLGILFNEDLDRYYDLRQCKIKRDVIQMRLNTLLNVVSFSKPFVQTLASMLEETESVRPALHELFNQFERAKNSVNFQPI
jgi:hypothetical protein